MNVDFCVMRGWTHTFLASIDCSQNVEDRLKENDR